MDTEDVKEIVKETVKNAVRYCGSQVEFARRAGISQGAVGKYLRKEALPTGVTAKKLSAAVDGTISKNKFAPHIFQD